MNEDLPPSIVAHDAELLPPTPYEVAVEEASDDRGMRLVDVFCSEHGTAVGVVDATTLGALYAADVPLEHEAGTGDVARRFKQRTGRRMPAIAYQIRHLIEHPDCPRATWRLGVGCAGGCQSRWR